MDDTSLAAGRSAFPPTRWEDLLRAKAESAETVRTLLAELSASYWRPVYKFIRVSWRKSNEDAKDLTQEFFATVVQPAFLAKADPERGSFRTFLLASVKNFLRDQEKHRNAQKRGGGSAPLPIDLADADLQVPGGTNPEEEFMRSWAESLLAEALGEMERGFAARGRPQVFRVFKAHSIETQPGHAVTYSEIARTLGLTVSEVTNHLFEARRELGRILSERVRRYVASDAEVEAELKALFGK